MGDPHAEALDWADRARRRRAQLRNELSDGARTLAEVLDTADHDALVGRVRVLFVLESLPGARKTDTRRALAALGIDGTRALQDLDPDERATVLATFVPGQAA